MALLRTCSNLFLWVEISLILALSELPDSLSSLQAPRFLVSLFFSCVKLTSAAPSLHSFRNSLELSTSYRLTFHVKAEADACMAMRAPATSAGKQRNNSHTSCRCQNSWRASLRQIHETQDNRKVCMSTCRRSVVLHQLSGRRDSNMDERRSFEGFTSISPMLYSTIIIHCVLLVLCAPSG